MKKLALILLLPGTLVAAELIKEVISKINSNSKIIKVVVLLADLGRLVDKVSD